jgi:hypothetical protein
MATESDSTEIRGKGWSARLPTALLVTTLIGLGTLAFDMVRRLDRIEAKIDATNERIAHERELSAERHAGVTARVSALEGARGASSN